MDTTIKDKCDYDRMYIALLDSISKSYKAPSNKKVTGITYSERRVMFAAIIPKLGIVVSSLRVIFLKVKKVKSEMDNRHQQ